jgi:demethylmenaquinone methyltransferase/2-methoxy-6-polyprenyl-1,4-benzoquinol methylase
MVNKSKIKNATSFHDRINIIQQDLLKNQLPSNHYDFISCAFGLKTFDNSQLEILGKTLELILKQTGLLNGTCVRLKESSKNILAQFYWPVILIHGIIPVPLI